jgi:surface antigen
MKQRYQQMKKLITLFAVFALTLAGCAGYNQQRQGPNVSKQGIGAVTGAIAGGLAGSAIGGGTGRDIAIGTGVLLGALAGSEIGKSLDRADRAYMVSAYEEAHDEPVGQTVYWENPESGHRGSVTPLRQGRRDDGEVCREYQQTIIVDGTREQATGIACQRSDGTWEIQ